jgi:membrane protease YdiL (CAAX protease family)
MKVMSRWATVGFAVLAVVLGAVVASVAVRLMIPVDLYGRTWLVAVFSLVFSPVMIITLMLASRRSGSSVLAYLGLDIPRRRHIAITVAGLALWIIFTAILDLVLDRDAEPFMLAIYRSAQAEGSLIWLWLETVVVAPIREELLFRGFMFRGFVHTQRDAIPSIVFISLIWSLTHFRYDWLTIAEVFVLGLLLGLVRWRTGSTTLTILLHAVNNLVSLILFELD